jgi:protein-S-isoprenylcysteine O-methyltransferase Ste14
MSETKHMQTPGRVTLRLIQVFIFAAILTSLYFWSAGSFRLVWGWIFLAIYFAFNLSMVIFAGESLIQERSKTHKDSMPWDRYLSLIPLLCLLGILIVSGLDVRQHWTPDLPLWLRILAAIFLIGAMAVNTWAVKSNPFYSSTVRIQTDRGHQVIDSGPYAFIRHPTYAMAHIIHIALALMLGSFWALVPTLIGSIGLIVRTALEDKTLQARLPGYAEYSKRVRYRMIPGIW